MKYKNKVCICDHAAGLFIGENMSYSEISSSYPKARKQYRCEWCNEIILIGEKHFQRSYKFDDNFRNGRMHLECEKSMNEYPDRDDLIDGWMPGDFKRGKT